jgi:hypothetical protein
MNWEAVGAISEAIGVVAILISLAYLAMQIRQSTREFSRGLEANQLAAFESNIESGNRIRELLILNPDLLQLLADGYPSYKKLDGAAKLRFGMLDEILQQRGAREWLETNNPDWRLEFQELVDQRLVAIKEE